MFEKLVRLMRGHLRDLSSEDRQAELKRFLIEVLQSKETDVIPTRPNSKGSMLECPYGLFKSRTHCAMFILENHREEFLEKCNEFVIPTYTDRLVAKYGGCEDRHRVYWTIVQMCQSKKYPDWNFLDYRIKKVD